jgi:PadR family transcriptional regulator, regulatory protein PadR
MRGERVDIEREGERERGREGGDCCDMRGMLGFLILFLLSKKPMHGQELAGEIAIRKGDKKLSPGTIYPALKGLKELGFIVEERDGKTIVYSLTDKGEKALKLAKRKFIKTFFGIFPE